MSPAFRGRAPRRGEGARGPRRIDRALGATLAEREQRGFEWNLPFLVRLLEEHLGRARAALGSEAAAAAEAEGRALPFEDAVEEAVHASSVAETT